ENGIDLYVADVATGQSKLVASGLNGTGGDPCDWLEDSAAVLYQLVVTPRGPEPPAPAVPTGPNIQKKPRKAAPAATLEDRLNTEQDEKLFEYFSTSQLAAVDTATGKKTPIGRPALLDANRLSPNNEYILVTKIERPFSRLVTMNGFPKTVEIWNRKGEA